LGAVVLAPEVDAQQFERLAQLVGDERCWHDPTRRDAVHDVDLRQFQQPQARSYLFERQRYLVAHLASGRRGLNHTRAAPMTVRRATPGHAVCSELARPAHDPAGMPLENHTLAVTSALPVR